MSTAAVKICFILGTRPEITKLYSIIKASYRNEEVHPLIIHTGQHYDYEMSQIFLEELELPTPHYFLDVESGTHGQMTATLLAFGGLFSPIFVSFISWFLLDRLCCGFTF